MADLKIWKPLSFLQRDYDHKIALIKLNTPFHSNEDVRLFTRLWKHAVLRACTDGAANVLYDCVGLSHSECLPNFVSGDFDSVRSDVLDYYKNKGCEIIATPDQNETDFTKCLRLIVNKVNSSKLEIDCVVAHVNTEGRLDHILANIDTLFRAVSLTTTPVYLVTGESLACLLGCGKHLIEVSSPMCGKWCSLVPIGRPCERVSTSGLVYNLDNQPMSFGHIVSTSNAFDGSLAVTVETDQPLLWSMGLLYID